jgi:ParB family chromosome partitioning protein
VIEEARALKRLCEEFALTHEQVAQAVGRSRSAVTNMLRLTELAPQVQDKVLDGALEMGHARALAVLPPAQQILLAEKIAAQKLTVRDAEKLAQTAATAPKIPTAQVAIKKDPDLARLEEELAEALGAYVSLKPGKSGTGEILVRYASLEQLDGIVERMKR